MHPDVATDLESLDSTLTTVEKVLDIDELSAATSAGLISAEDAELAIDTTLDAVEGITRHGDDAMAWLAHHGIDLSWSENVTLAPEG